MINLITWNVIKNEPQAQIATVNRVKTNFTKFTKHINIKEKALQAAHCVAFGVNFTKMVKR